MPNQPIHGVLMANVKKVPYYHVRKGLFGSEVKKVSTARGCIPLNTPRGISIDRLAPGMKPSPPPKASLDAPKNARAEPAPRLRKSAKENQKKKKSPPEQLEAEICENPPVFDLQDVPVAMDNLGWTVSAKLARRWFSGPANIYDNNPKSIQPINDTDVTLEWTLRFGSVRKKYEKLLSKDIYNEAAIDTAKLKVLTKIKKRFSEERTVNLGFNTSSSLSDLLQFHIDWQFQLLSLSDGDTFDGLTLTDLTGALANFTIYIAVGNVEISGEKYFRYERSKNLYCLDAVGRITHVYAYVKDNYSFNGEQYLGHWNKQGIIIAPGTWLTGSTQEKRDSDIDIWVKAINKPVDTRRSLFGKFKEPDVYFPVFNADYNQWRERHRRGQDFMIYSKPVHLKLSKPIVFKLGEICRPEPLNSLA